MEATNFVWQYSKVDVLQMEPNMICDHVNKPEGEEFLTRLYPEMGGQVTHMLCVVVVYHVSIIARGDKNKILICFSTPSKELVILWMAYTLDAFIRFAGSEPLNSKTVTR